MKSKYFKIRHLLAVLGIGFIVISSGLSRHEGSNINDVNLEILHISFASVVEFKVTQVGKAIEIYLRIVR
ncbi:hypothetical protein SAMN06297280_1811 [Arsukibacterium tuosuense]|uniref:Uncharacterized protein n=1 Tax=Arsukibacterium tuosuense TaxID=1323745 RepID=A0A285IW29_9GAMM|nr:hypothetical protein SAMN06297280_1811 [Arsukibacterium tuosuense]